MKALKLIIVGLLLLFSVGVKAQISVRVNIGTPPQWGPSEYTDVRYYYLPDVEAYYDVPSSMFIYFNGVRWVHRSYLPSRYRDYDLYNGYKVVMTDYRGNTPYTHFREYRIKYAKGYRGEHQKTFGERPERGKFNEREDFYKGRNSNERGHSNGYSKQKENRSKNQSERRGNDSKKNNHRAHGNDKN